MFNDGIAMMGVNHIPLLALLRKPAFALPFVSRSPGWQASQQRRAFARTLPFAFLSDTLPFFLQEDPENSVATLRWIPGLATG